MTDQMRQSSIDALPMEMTQAAIVQWVDAVVASTDDPVHRAEALIERQDRQALHGVPFSGAERRYIEIWLNRFWDARDAQLADAGATLNLSQDWPVTVLEKMTQEGSAETIALVQEALEEWSHGRRGIVDGVNAAE